MSKIEFLSPEGLRVDGRRPNELRKVQCRLGVFKQADGSAYFEQGNTKVLATVYGPHEPRLRSKALHDRTVIQCEFSVATFSTGERKKRPKGDRRAVEFELIVQSAFEAAIMTHLFPRSQIDIFLQVLQADGGVHAAALNAATLALIDAGIPMRDYVVACTAGRIEMTPVLDLNYIEDSANGPEVTAAIMPKSGKLVALEMDGRTHADTIEEVIELASSGCGALYATMDAEVRQRTRALADAIGPLDD